MTQSPPPPYGTIPYYSPLPPPPKLRPTSVTVMAVIGIIFGAIGVACSPFALVPYFVQMGPPNPVIDAVKSDPVLFGWMVVAMAIHIPLSIVLLAGSIGALNLKLWARKALLFWSVAAIVMNVIGMIVNLTLMFPKLSAIQGQNPRSAAAVTGGIAGGIGGFIFGMIVPILMLYFMTRPQVKQAFEMAASGLAPGAPGPPGAPAAGGPATWEPPPPGRMPGNP